MVWEVCAVSIKGSHQNELWKHATAMTEVQLIRPWGLLSPFQTYDLMILLLLTACVDVPSIASELIDTDSSVT